MKLRIRGNTLRFRLTQGEVDALAASGRVEDGVTFGPGARLVYALATSARAAAPEARLEGARVEVTLPEAAVRAWASTEQVGIEADQAIEGGGSLRLLVEKDFACLKPRTGEDDEDAFPNPAAHGPGC